MGRARSCNPTAGFSTDMVAAGLCRLYTIDGGQLMPELDADRVPPACPITLAPMEDPVLLEDGVVYEQVAIAQWLESNSNAPCTNIQVQKFRLLRLEPLRDVFNKFSKSKQGLMPESWRTQLLKVEELAARSSGPLLARCVRVEQAIAACMVEAAELEAGLQAAHCTANRLRAELCEYQEKGIVRLQSAARCCLARRQLRALRLSLRLLRSAMQVHVARRCLETLIQRRGHAVVQIQRWWKKHQKKTVSLPVGKVGKAAKRRRHRRRKKARGKASLEPGMDRAHTTRPYTMFHFWDPEIGEFWRTPPESGSGSRLREVFEKGLPGWERYHFDLYDIQMAYNSDTGDIAWATFAESTMPAVKEGVESRWRRREEVAGKPCYVHEFTGAVWYPGEPSCDNLVMVSLVDEIANFSADELD